MHVLLIGEKVAEFYCLLDLVLISHSAVVFLIKLFNKPQWQNSYLNHPKIIPVIMKMHMLSPRDI